jgi:hypothetical protein
MYVNGQSSSALMCVLALCVLLLGATPASSDTTAFDVYGGYRGIRSQKHRAFTGTSTHLQAHRLVDANANFPPHSLVGTYLHPNVARASVPITKHTTDLEVLRYRIVENTRSEIFTDPQDGKLTHYARTGDAYKTSGFFTVEKVGQRWWYMTPEGHAFIALSVSVVTPDARDGEDKTGRTYTDYVKAKYGGESAYRENWANATLARLRQWGFNTIGTFSHKIQTQPYLKGRLPYVVTLRLSNNAVLKQVVGNLWEGIGGGKFPDLWHPDFAASIDERMRQMASAQMVRDPYVLYLFPDQADELRGIAAHHYSLGWAALAGQPEISGHPNYTKRHLRDMLQAKYQDIQRLNEAWGTTYTTWGSAGGYPHGTGFLDQGKPGIPGPTYQAIAEKAPPAMQADLQAFVEQLFRRYAELVTTTIRKYDPHHLITTPNGVSLETAIKAFDGYFDIYLTESAQAYELLRQKRPLGASSMGYLSADRDSPLRLEGWLVPKAEPITVQTQWGQRQHLKVWAMAQDFWFDLQRGNPLHVTFLDENMHMLDLGKSPGNQFDILQTGTDATGGWMLIRSRGYHTGSVEEIAERLGGKQKKIYYRRRGFGNQGKGGFLFGYDTQEDRARAWEAGLHRDLTERAANGDYVRIGANWWKLSDNGWTYWLERYNFGLVTMKDNAYDGREATKLGADGKPGTLDDETNDYGDFLSGVTRTNTSIYTFIQQHDAAPRTSP